MTGRSGRCSVAAATGSMLIFVYGCGPASDVAVPLGDAARGQQLLARYHCGTCHTIPGVAASRGQLAASLAQFGRRSYIAGRVANEPAMLVRWIVSPASIVPDTAMPDMGVSEPDARDIAAYLGQLR